MRKPTQNEYPKFYNTYVSKIDTEDIVAYLETQRDQFKELINQLPEDKYDYAYESDKWTIRELIGHCTDTERVFSFRAMSFARGEKQTLPGFDQDDYVNDANFKCRDTNQILEEFCALRSANIALFKSFDEEILSKEGMMSGGEITVRALLYIMAGHLEHHMMILKEKYI